MMAVEMLTPRSLDPVCDEQKAHELQAILHFNGAPTETLG